MFDRSPVWTWCADLAAIAVVVTLITVSFNLMAGSASAQLRFRGSGVFFIALLSTMTLPAWCRSSSWSPASAMPGLIRPAGHGAGA